MIDHLPEPIQADILAHCPFAVDEIVCVFELYQPRAIESEPVVLYVDELADALHTARTFKHVYFIIEYDDQAHWLHDEFIKTVASA